MQPHIHMTKRQADTIAAMATRCDPRWQRVLARDAACDGVFYYSVKTSGVYCLPSCKSRPALPQNVAFYKTCGAAVEMGFRACKRCKPDQFTPKKGN